MENKIKYYVGIEFLLLLSIIAAVFLVDLKETRFTGDENTWINESSHFEDFFTGNFSAFTPKTPEETFFILTMPTIPEYVIGLSRKMGGYSAAQVKKVKLIDWTKTTEENVALDNMVPKDLLWWSRILPSLLSILTILTTFYLIKLSFNLRAGYLWLISILINPWLIKTLQRAMGDPPLLFFIIMAILAGFLTLKSFKDDVRSMMHSLFWLILFGIFTGLAGQSKTNGLLIFGAGVVILLILTIRCQTDFRWRFFSIGFAALTISTFLFFVGPNPFLWNDPIGKTIQIFTYRLEVMHGVQANKDTKRIITSWDEGARIALSQIFTHLTSVQFINAEYLKMIFASFGFVIFLSKTWQSLRTKFASMNSGVLSILLVGLCASVPSLFTPINVERYYLLPVYFASILIVVGFDWLLQYAISIKSASIQMAESQPKA